MYVALFNKIYIYMCTQFLQSTIHVWAVYIRGCKQGFFSTYHNFLMVHTQNCNLNTVNSEIFTNSIKRHICDLKNCNYDMIYLHPLVTE